MIYCKNLRRLGPIGHNTFKPLQSDFSRDVVSVETSRSRDVLTSRLGLGAICLGRGPVGLVSGHCVSSRRFVEARAVHTVGRAAVRAILTSMTFCGLDIFVYTVFTLSFTFLS